MSEGDSGRFLDKALPPTGEEIDARLGPAAAERLSRLESFLRGGYTLSRELRFPYGNGYGWGYKYSHKTRHLCDVFFERGAFTVLLSLGRGELAGLQRALPALLPKTRALWESRYPCGEGGWIHYRVESDEELADIETLIGIRKKPADTSL